MALSKQTLYLAKSLYWVFFILAHLYLCYILFATNRVITGVIWLILGFIGIFIFYFVYFPAGDADSQWPPYISACPDYMTLIAPNKCADFVGLNSGLIRKSSPKTPPAPSDTTRVFDSAGNVSQKAANAQQMGLTWQGIA
jgi:hypothetical protein